MVGVPDYETYVVIGGRHPDLPVMTYEEFFRERQQARYAVGRKTASISLSALRPDGCLR